MRKKEGDTVELNEVIAETNGFMGFFKSDAKAVVSGTIESISTITGQVICKVARSDASDIEKALDAAHAAKESWGRTSATERANILNKIADRMKGWFKEL